LSEDIGKTAIPQHLVDKMRSAGVAGARKDGCPPGRDRYPISAERLKPTPFGHILDKICYQEQNREQGKAPAKQGVSDSFLRNET
jgi:hypothetical protein